MDTDTGGTNHATNGNGDTATTTTMAGIQAVKEEIVEEKITPLPSPALKVEASTAPDPITVTAPTQAPTPTTNTENAGTSHQPILLQGAEEDEEDDDEDMFNDDDDDDEEGGPIKAETPSFLLGGTSTVAPLIPIAAPSRELTCDLFPSIVPSPFAHHNDVATSDRYRSALERIQANPSSDEEAWMAVMNECTTLYANTLLPQLKEERSVLKDTLGLNQMTTTGLGGRIKPEDVVASKGISVNTAGVVRHGPDLEKRLDWAESCHGHLLRYFPYSTTYCVSIIQLLMARSALPFESFGDNGSSMGMGGGMGGVFHGGGPEDDIVLLRSLGFVAMDAIQEPNNADLKINQLLELVLGVTLEGEPVTPSTSTKTKLLDPEQEQHMHEDENGLDCSPSQVIGGICTSCVDLWILYIRKRTRDAKRQAFLHHLDAAQLATYNPNPSVLGILPPLPFTPEGHTLIRNAVQNAYETALNNGCAFGTQNHIIWKQYLAECQSWVPKQSPSSLNVMEAQPSPSLIGHQKQTLRTIYQRMVSVPMLGLDQVWMEYDAWEKGQSEALAVALIAEFLPKYQHARSVYLERGRVCPSIVARRMLSVPPVDFKFVRGAEDDVGDGGEEDGTGTVGVGVGSKLESSERRQEYTTQMKEEARVLSQWKKRCAYERTNPERLSMSDLTIRIRQCYKDAVCEYMRHIEVWHEWSTWELHNSSSSTSATVTTSSSGAMNGDSDGITGKKRSVQMAIAVLKLGQEHIPDSTLLAWTHAQTVEELPKSTFMGMKSVSGIGLDDLSPGDAAIRIMSEFCNRAGNTLGYIMLQRLVRKYKGIKDARNIFATARRLLRTKESDVIDSGLGPRTARKGENDLNANMGDEAKAEFAVNSESNGMSHSADISRKLVVNRLDSSLRTNASISRSQQPSQPEAQSSNRCITWHLYSAHATIEHRLNKSPHIAARVFELGLRKHRTFLSTPQFVMQYGSLLFELNDEENLRALLTRAIAACEEVNSTDSEEGSKIALAAKEAQRPLWDMMLKFESILSCRNGDLSTLHALEARRRKALYGPKIEDVTGGMSAVEGGVGIGMNKTSLNENLFLTEGYDVSSRIANGLSRIVDSLEVTGILCPESHTDTLLSMNAVMPGMVWKDDGAGGLSDASFRRRKFFELECTVLQDYSGNSAMSTAHTTGVAQAGKLLTAKERLAQTVAQGQNTTIMAAVHASPEWLRGLLLQLPATARNYRGAKAPPHLIEMALSALRANALPTERPNDLPSNSMGGITAPIPKRLRENGNGDSSDEEENNGSSGYSSQFRARQRARIGT